MDREEERERENIDIRCSRAVTAINIHTVTWSLMRRREANGGSGPTWLMGADGKKKNLVNCAVNADH